MTRIGRILMTVDKISLLFINQVNEDNFLQCVNIFEANNIYCAQLSYLRCLLQDFFFFLAFLVLVCPPPSFVAVIRGPFLIVLRHDNSISIRSGNDTDLFPQAQVFTAIGEVISDSKICFPPSEIYCSGMHALSWVENIYTICKVF